jgi:ferric-dicitrate binding protein FerR (iron transport regulator)
MSTCTMIHRDLLAALDGSADEALRLHIAECDACRDARHALGQSAARLAKAGDDHPATPVLAERLAAIVADEASKAAAPAERVSVTRLKTEAQQRPSKKALWLALAAFVSVGTSVAIGFKLADRERAPSAIASRAWHGKVATIATAPGAAGLKRDGASLKEGDEVGAGMHLVTDPKTRVRLALDDGSTVVLDRATDLVIGSEPRTMTLNAGAILAEVAHIDGAPTAKLKTPNGDVDVLGTKLAVTAIPDRTNVEVLRGEVELKNGRDAHRISAGQEGVATKAGVDVAPVNDLAQRAAFGEQLLGSHNEDAEAPASGLGELRAKRPGRADEKDHAVRLARHAVKVRIAGNVARTEIDETFANDTDDELEGIYRFPLPPGAQIERLALEVDGKDS